MQTPSRWRWWTVALRGVAALLFGIAAMLAPAATFAWLVLCFGAFAIVDGALAVALASRAATGTRGAMVGHGLVSIAAGVVTLAWPGITALALLWLIGVWAIVSGGFELATAFGLHRRLGHDWLLAVEGAVSIGFGVLLLLAPLTGAIVLALWVGAFALLLGGLLVGTSLRLREAARDWPVAA